MRMTSYSLMYTKILVHDMMHQKPWTTMTGGANYLTLMVLILSIMNPQTNISNLIFILAKITYNYRRFEAN